MKPEYLELIKAGVPRRYYDASLTNHPEMFRRTYSLNGNYFLTGDRGTGKTHLMVSYLADDIKNRIANKQSILPCYKFISVPRLLFDLRSLIKSDNGDETELVQTLIDCDYLFLDDLGVEKVSEWVIQTLYLIIDSRYANLKPMFISSNYSLGELSERIDDRITSRLAEICTIVEMGGIDQRCIKT